MNSDGGPYVRPTLTPKTQRALLVRSKMYVLAALGGTSLSVGNMLNTVRGSLSPTAVVDQKAIMYGLTDDQLLAGRIGGYYAAATAAQDHPQTIPATLALKIDGCGDLLLQSDHVLNACEAYLDVAIAQIAS